MSSRALTIAGYILVVLALMALEVASSFRGSGVPPFRVVVERVMRTRSGRVRLLAAWAWLGLHFFAR
jgi:hypothetical protein